MKSSRKKHSAPPSASRASVPRKPAAPLLRSAGMLFALLVLLRLLAAQFPDLRLWGLSYGGFLPLWAQLLAAAVGVLFATPLLYPMYRWKETLYGGSRLSLIAVAAGAGAAVLFWLLRMDTVFLGDGASYLAEHFRYVRDLPVSEDVLFSPGSAPLTAWLLAKTSLALIDTGASGTLTAQPQLSWWIYGAATGGLFIGAVLLLVRRAAEGGAQRLALTAMLLLTPGLLFFFGYVEYYTFAFAALGIFLLVSLAVLRGKMSPLWLVAVFVLMTLFHVMMLMALPGLLLTLAARHERLRTAVTLRNLLIATAAVLAAGGIFYFASGIATEGSRVILALHPFGEEGAVQHYTLLAPAHLVDIVNMLALAAGPALLVLAFVPWKKRTWSADEVIMLTHVLYFAFLLVFGYTCFGMARDWDVNAGFGLAAGAFAVVMLRRRDEAERSYLYYLAAGAALVAVLPWIAVNVDDASSERRFRAVMELDDDLITGDFALNGYEHLRKYYQSTGDGDAVAWAIRKKVEMVGYPDDYRKLMLQLLSSLQGSRLKEYLDWVFLSLEDKIAAATASGTDELYAGPRIAFLELYAEFMQQIPYLSSLGEGREDYFSMRLDRFRDAAGDHALVDFAAAQYAVELRGRNADHAVLLRAAGAIEHSSILAVTCGRMLLSAGEVQAARELLARALTMDEAFTLPHYYLGEAWASGPGADTDKAIMHYQQFLSMPEGHRVSDASMQQRMMDAARQRIGSLELQRLQIP
jgi:hypothetical protein